MDEQLGPMYLARKALFAKAVRQGRLTVQEIEAALPRGAVTAAETWLLYYSLRAAHVEIVDERSGRTDPGFGSDGPSEFSDG